MEILNFVRHVVNSCIMMKYTILFCIGLGLVVTSCRHHQPSIQQQKEFLGKMIFRDENLSTPPGQSCATCHDMERGYADKEGRIVSEGAVKGLFSARNSMSICYSTYVPQLHYDDEEETYVGGLFWDGRTPDLQSQAGEPFLNPVEMGNTVEAEVIEKIRKADYYPMFEKIYGVQATADSLYLCITDALAAYESSAEINPFSSKYDAYLEGKYELTEAEQRGLELFKNKGMCAECHILDEDPRAGKPLFTDHTYDNLGIPRNPDNPHYQVPAEYFTLMSDSIDRGLGTIVGKKEEYGKFRVPTLRNIEKTAPYGHNGYFATLEEIVHFYNMRLVSSEYPAPEYPATVNVDELGNLGLTPQEEGDIVMFMRTLSDGFMCR